MQHQASSLIREVNIDYITTTAVERLAAKRLASFGRHCVTEEANRGAKLKVWRVSGYRGLQADHAAFGIRRDGAIIKLSGRAAAEYWEQASLLGTNTTRLDLQVTVFPVDGPTTWLRRHYEQVRKRKLGRGRPFKYKLFVGPSGPETLRLGTNQSDRWMRVYDKGLQSKLPKYEGTLRYELQLNRSQALSMVQQLSATEFQQSEIFRHVEEFASARLTRLAFSADTWLESVGASSSPRLAHAGPSKVPTLAGSLPPGSTNSLKEEDEAYRKLTWARACLRPTIERLIAAGLLGEVLEALGIMDGLLVHVARAKSAEQELISSEVM